MTLHGLLGDVLAQLRPTEQTTPESPQTPTWITDRITSVAGMLVLNRADLADQVQLVLQIAGALCREGRTSARTLAQKHGWPPPLIQRTRRALSLIWAGSSSCGGGARVVHVRLEGQGMTVRFTLMPMCGLSPLETMIQQQPAITCH